jgi:hypothetical protein
MGSKSGTINTVISGGSTPLDVNVGLVGSASQPVTLDAGLNGELGVAVTGDPTKPLAVDLGLKATGDPAHPVAVDLGLQVHVDQLDLKLEPLKVTLDPLKVDLGLDNINVCLSLAVTKFPQMRMHMPKKYDFGLNLFGIQVYNFSVYGESSIITEDNSPRVFDRFTSVRPEREPRMGRGLEGDSAFHVDLE